MSDLPAPRQRIVLLIGLPGSGKSTWLAGKGIVPLSSDAVRQLLADDPTDQTIHGRVFATIRYLLRQRLAIGRPVTYIDATHLTREDRYPYVQIAAWYGCDLEAVFFDVPADVCVHRNSNRTRVVPPEAIRMLAGKLLPPTPEEGFTRIVTVKVFQP